MLIAAPWFVVMRWIHESVFYDYLLVSETKKSIGISLLNIGSNATLYTKNWFLYFLPTSWILTVGLLDRIRNANGTDETEQRIVRFLWTWVAAILFLFVILVYEYQSGYYLLPMTPSLAMLASYYTLRNRDAVQWRRLWCGFLTTALFIIPKNDK